MVRRPQPLAAAVETQRTHAEEIGPSSSVSHRRSLAIAHSGSRYITLHIECRRVDELLTGQLRPVVRSSSRNDRP